MLETRNKRLPLNFAKAVRHGPAGGPSHREQVTTVVEGMGVEDRSNAVTTKENQKPAAGSIAQYDDRNGKSRAVDGHKRKVSENDDYNDMDYRTTFKKIKREDEANAMGGEDKRKRLQGEGSTKIS